MKLIIKMLVALLLGAVAIDGYATTVVLRNGTKVDLGDGVPYGPSVGYNPSDTPDVIRKKMKKRLDDLQAARNQLRGKLGRERDKAKKELIRQQLKDIKVARKKGIDDSEFEDELHKDTQRPKTQPAIDTWKIKKRRERLGALKKAREKWLEEQKKKKMAAVSLADLNEMSETPPADVIAAHQQIIEEVEAQAEIADRLAENNCSLSEAETGGEACYEMLEAHAEASMAINEAEAEYNDLIASIPPVILAGGEIVRIGWELIELRKLHKAYLTLIREKKTCQWTDTCTAILQKIGQVQDDYDAIEMIETETWEQIQDQTAKEELASPTEAVITVPEYLINTKIPFGATDFLPLVFKVDTMDDETNFNHLSIEVNNHLLPATYFPDAGIISAKYQGFGTKEDFKGTVVLASVDGRVFTQNFSGSINNSKPQIAIKKIGGGIRRASFIVSIKGDFNQVEIYGTNVKPSVYKYASIQHAKKINVPTLVRGFAEVKVRVSLPKKVAKIPTEFGGQKRLTAPSGRIWRPESDMFVSNLTALTAKTATAEILGKCCADAQCEECTAVSAGKDQCRGFVWTHWKRDDNGKCEAL